MVAAPSSGCGPQRPLTALPMRSRSTFFARRSSSSSGSGTAAGRGQRLGPPTPVAGAAALHVVRRSDSAARNVSRNSAPAANAALRPATAGAATPLPASPGMLRTLAARFPGVVLDGAAPQQQPAPVPQPPPQRHSRQGQRSAAEPRELVFHAPQLVVAFDDAADAMRASGGDDDGIMAFRPSATSAAKRQSEQQSAPRLAGGSGAAAWSAPQRAGEYAVPGSVPPLVVVARGPEERRACPERLNLDLRQLAQLPCVFDIGTAEDADGGTSAAAVRLINLQRNELATIDPTGKWGSAAAAAADLGAFSPTPLSTFRGLVFLDLYGNRLTELGRGLVGVHELRVLLLGANRLRSLDGLAGCCAQLDVLDAHDNELTDVAPGAISHLRALRVLNLAGNGLSGVVAFIDGAQWHLALEELNLRRNRLEGVGAGVAACVGLTKLLLSSNRLSGGVERCGIARCLAACGALTELSLDNNPLTAPEGKNDAAPPRSGSSNPETSARGVQRGQLIAMAVGRLRLLDGVKVTEAERAAAVSAGSAPSHAPPPASSAVASMGRVGAAVARGLALSSTARSRGPRGTSAAAARAAGGDRPEVAVGGGRAAPQRSAPGVSMDVGSGKLILDVAAVAAALCARGRPGDDTAISSLVAASVSAAFARAAVELEVVVDRTRPVACIDGSSAANDLTIAHFAAALPLLEVLRLAPAAPAAPSAAGGAASPVGAGGLWGVLLLSTAVASLCDRRRRRGAAATAADSRDGFEWAATPLHVHGTFDGLGSLTSDERIFLSSTAAAMLGGRECVVRLVLWHTEQLHQRRASARGPAGGDSEGDRCGKDDEGKSSSNAAAPRAAADRVTASELAALRRYFETLPHLRKGPLRRLHAAAQGAMRGRDDVGGADRARILARVQERIIAPAAAAAARVHALDAALPELLVRPMVRECAPIAPVSSGHTN